MDMLYNTTNGRAHNNSTTCCTTNSLPTDKNFPHPNILTCRDVGLWHCDVANICPLVMLYNMSVAGVRVVEFGTNRRDSTDSGVQYCGLPARLLQRSALRRANRDAQQVTTRALDTAHYLRRRD